MRKSIQIGVLCCVAMLLISSCSVKKYIPEEERLYTGASVEIESDTELKNKKQLETVLEEVLRPKPNKNFLGMPLGLYFYYKMQKDNPGFINRFFYKRMGQEPVYQSDVKPFEVNEILLNRLENRGFFYSAVEYEFHEKEKEASVVYSVKVSEPYLMERYQLDSLPEPIHSEIENSVSKTQFEKGMRFDLNYMKHERDRIDIDLKSNGYYNFNSNFLIFEADTNQYDKKRFDLFLRLKKETPKRAIVPYKISKINVYADYDAQDLDEENKELVRFNDKNYINSENFFKPKYLDPFITMSEGQYYSPENSRNTARRLSTIGAYKFVNIQYTEVDSVLTDSLGTLEADIYLSPLNKRVIRAELQAVTKSNGFAGPGLALNYGNRNLFKGGETLNTTGRFGYEFQAGGGSGSETSIELGLSNELIIPRMLFPINIDQNYFKYDIPKTKIGAHVEYLNRAKLYALLTATAEFGYVWQANRFVTHEITPISLNYTKKVRTSKAFDSILDQNPFLRRSFEQRFIPGGQYSYTYNGMIDARQKHQFYVNANIDIAGNSMSLFGQKQDEGGKTVLGMQYAQYAKADVDLRYHFNLGKEQIIASRIFAGYGLPYGNSEVMPFIKQYYSGGPYSVRAFRIRSLGPGTFRGEEGSNSFYDRSGNIRFEANVEYRFPLFSFFKGAVFADAGNIWNSKGNPEYNYQDKFTSSFISELGMGAGVGLRVDVQGFVIRFDFAAPFHDPTKEKGERLDFNVKETIFNFGIGYPF